MRTNTIYAEQLLLASSSMEENMEKKERQGKEGDELLQAVHAQLWTQVFSFANSQTLRCAVELHIPDIIHAHAGPMTLSHLASKLPLPSSPDRLRRLMCFLSHLNIFKHSTMITPSGGDEREEDAYELTPLSRLLVRGEEKNMVPMVTVGFNVLMVPWHHIIGSLEKSSDNAFKRVFGVEFYQYAEQDAELGVRLNEVMACDTRWTMPGVIEWKEVFEGVGSLVDVGGGTGTAARAIAEAFPAIKCTVFDHPHVVESAPECEDVARIGGDMFEFIPPADALFLKWILHNYGDEECRKILKRCKEALPEKGGKVIIVDTVMDGDDDGAGDEFKDARLALDLEMMLLFGGKERTEEEWRRLLQHAGFSKCRIMPIKSSIHSLIEASLIIRMPNAHQIKELQGNPPARISKGKDALTNQKKDSRGRISEAYVPEKKIHGCEPPSEKVCKNNRIWKRCMLDGAFDKADEDDEIRHLEKLTTAKSSVDYGFEFRDNGEEENKKQKTSEVSKKKKDHAEYDDVLMLKNMLYNKLARMVRNQNQEERIHRYWLF